MSGILVTLEPVVLRLGPFALRWSGLMLIVALVAGLWVTLRQSERSGLGPAPVLDLASWALPLGFVGARLLDVLESWEYYFARPGEVLDLGRGGLSFWGGLILGGAVSWLFCRRARIPVAILADASAPGLALAEAIGRLGAFLSGEGQGSPADLPWASRYSSADALTPDVGVLRHPAQVYQGLADLVILGLLWLLRGAPLARGARFWLWLGLYAIARLTISLVRLDPPLLLHLSESQLVGLAALALSAFAMIRLAGHRPTHEAALRR